MVKYYLEPKSAQGDSSITVVGRRAKKGIAKRTLTMEEIRKYLWYSRGCTQSCSKSPRCSKDSLWWWRSSDSWEQTGDSGSTINRHFIPLVFHFGGIRSDNFGELLESIEFYPSNFTPEFGRFTGGIVDARFRRPKDDRLHVEVEADIFDAGFLVEGPVSKNATFAVAGRRSYIDAALEALPDDVISLLVARNIMIIKRSTIGKNKHRVRLYFSAQMINYSS